MSAQDSIGVRLGFPWRCYTGVTLILRPLNTPESASVARRYLSWLPVGIRDVGPGLPAGLLRSFVPARIPTDPLSFKRDGAGQRIPMALTKVLRSSGGHISPSPERLKIWLIYWTQFGGRCGPDRGLTIKMF